MAYPFLIVSSVSPKIRTFLRYPRFPLQATRSPTGFGVGRRNDIFPISYTVRPVKAFIKVETQVILPVGQECSGTACGILYLCFICYQYINWLCVIPLKACLHHEDFCHSMRSSDVTKPLIFSKEYVMYAALRLVGQLCVPGKRLSLIPYYAAGFPDGFRMGRGAIHNFICMMRYGSK